MQPHDAADLVQDVFALLVGNDYDVDFLDGSSGRDSFVHKLWWYALPRTKDTLFSHDSRLDFICY